MYKSKSEIKPYTPNKAPNIQLGSKLETSLSCCALLLL